RLPAQVVDAQPGLGRRLDELRHDVSWRAERREVVVDEEAGADPRGAAAQRRRVRLPGRVGPRRDLAEVPAKAVDAGLVVLHVDVTQLDREVAQPDLLDTGLGAGLGEGGLLGHHRPSHAVSSVNRLAISSNATTVCSLAVRWVCASWSEMSCSRHCRTGSSGTCPSITVRPT